MRDLQRLALPDTLDPLVVDCPARLAQQFGDLAIAITAVLASKLDWPMTPKAFHALFGRRQR